MDGGCKGAEGLGVQSGHGWGVRRVMALRGCKGDAARGGGAKGLWFVGGKDNGFWWWWGEQRGHDFVRGCDGAVGVGGAMGP